MPKTNDFLLPLVQRGVRDLPYEIPEGISVVVTRVEASRGFRRFLVHMTVFVLPTLESLFCENDPEPGCDSSFFYLQGAERLGNYLRRKLRLNHAVEVEFVAAIVRDEGVVPTRLVEE